MTTQEHLNTTVTTPQKRFTRVIVESVAARYGVSAADIFGVRRTGPITRARREAIVEIHLARPHWSYPMLALELGGKDHTSIMYALQKAGVYKPGITKMARAARAIGEFAAKYEGIGDMWEHKVCRMIARLAVATGRKGGAQ